ncbi:MAG: glycosyltransferase [Planctomycetota bacterium]|nr:glycosyltransferase [Planctomycetota bacterium]
MLSCIIPAHNEERYLPSTLAALGEALASVAQPGEVIVVDDASGDRTAEIAVGAGARLVKIARRQIAAARNAGAATASGDVLFFIDADTQVSADTLRAALAACEAGAVGGGAYVRLDENLGFWREAFLAVFNLFWFGLCGWAAGCFMFARRSDFEAIGGFDERYFAGEEMFFSQALKRRGRFALVQPPVITSARKAHLFSSREMLAQMLRIAWHGPAALQRREGLALWYEDRDLPPGRKTAKNQGQASASEEH